MEIKEIIQLIEAVSENALTSFELEQGNTKISIKKRAPRWCRWPARPAASPGRRRRL